MEYLIKHMYILINSLLSIIFISLRTISVTIVLTHFSLLLSLAVSSPTLLYRHLSFYTLTCIIVNFITCKHKRVVSFCIHTYRTDIHAYTNNSHSRMYKFIYTYVHIYKHIQTFKHTYKHIYKNAYIHTSI